LHRLAQNGAPHFRCSTYSAESLSSVAMSPLTISFIRAMTATNRSLSVPTIPLRANINETLSAAIITEQGCKENHRERSQGCYSFRSQFT